MHDFSGHLLVRVDPFLRQVPGVLSSKVVFSITERRVPLFFKLLSLIRNLNLVQTRLPGSTPTVQNFRVLLYFSVTSVALLGVIALILLVDFGVKFEIVDYVVYEI